MMMREEEEEEEEEGNNNNKLSATCARHDGVSFDTFDRRDLLRAYGEAVQAEFVSFDA